MKQVLAVGDTTGRPFWGTGGESLVIVNFASGGTLAVEVLTPNDVLTEYNIYVGLSTDTTFGANELTAHFMDTVTGPRHRVTLPNASGNHHYGFAVPSSKHITAIYNAAGENVFGDLSLQAATVTINAVAYQIWYQTTAVDPDTIEGQVWVVEVADDADWVNVSQSVLGASNIMADGQHRFPTSAELMYRLTPASAGSAAWLVDPAFHPGNTRQ